MKEGHHLDQTFTYLVCRIVSHFLGHHLEVKSLHISSLYAWPSPSQMGVLGQWGGPHINIYIYIYIYVFFFFLGNRPHFNMDGPHPPINIVLGDGPHRPPIFFAQTGPPLAAGGGWRRPAAEKIGQGLRDYTKLAQAQASAWAQAQAQA